MKNFRKLNLVNDAGEIFVNLDHVVSMVRQGNYTQVCTQGEKQNVFGVEETPDEILD